MVVGAVIALIYSIILLIKAFQTHVLWGLGYIFVPFVALIFVIMNWDIARKPFLMGLLGIPFYVAGILLLGMSAQGGSGF